MGCVWFYVAEVGAKPFNQMCIRKVCVKPLFFVSMSCLPGLVCRDNREILCHLDSLLRRRTTSDSSSEFLKIENKQIKTVQDNYYRTKLT